MVTKDQPAVHDMLVKVRAIAAQRTVRAPLASAGGQGAKRPE